MEEAFVDNSDNGAEDAEEAPVDDSHNGAEDAEEAPVNDSDNGAEEAPVDDSENGAEEAPVDDSDNGAEDANGANGESLFKISEESKARFQLNNEKEEQRFVPPEIKQLFEITAQANRDLINLQTESIILRMENTRRVGVSKRARTVHRRRVKEQQGEMKQSLEKFLNNISEVVDAPNKMNIKKIQKYLKRKNCNDDAIFAGVSNIVNDYK